jgi:hypothetical protein
VALAAALLVLNACANRETEAPSPTDDRAAAIAKVLALGEANEAAQDAPYDPVAFEAKLTEARKPYDKCIDDKIPEFKAKPIADKKLAVTLLLDECSSAFSPVADLINASPVAKMPDKEQEVIERVVGASRKRAEAALGAP